jgi:hypothetical protein
VVAAAPYVIVETDVQTRSSTSATMPLRPRSPPVGDASSRGAASSPCWKATGDQGGWPFGVRGPGEGEALVRLAQSIVIDEAAECDRLLLIRDGALLDQTARSCCAKGTGEHDLAAPSLP